MSCKKTVRTVFKGFLLDSVTQASSAQGGQKMAPDLSRRVTDSLACQVGAEN